MPTTPNPMSDCLHVYQDMGNPCCTCLSSLPVSLFQKFVGSRDSLDRRWLKHVRLHTCTLGEALCSSLRSSLFYRLEMTQRTRSKAEVLIRSLYINDFEPYSFNARRIK